MFLLEQMGVENLFGVSVPIKHLAPKMWLSKYKESKYPSDPRSKYEKRTYILSDS
jgi:hypothetical protein